jgi:lysophospholipase L1-like esterase
LALVAVMATLVVVGVRTWPTGTTPATTVAPPASMDALGDSITRGFNACGLYSDCPTRSWATGDDVKVDSHSRRIARVSPAITAGTANDAKSGASVKDLPAQVALAIGRRPQYVTILIGANDACAPTVAEMTPVDTFRTVFAQSVQTLLDALPDSHLFVASIPDLAQLWATGKDNPTARAVWDLGRICPSMLARSTSTDAADVARRSAVRDRVLAYNAVLGEVCRQHDRCLDDGGAVFSVAFSLADISTWDYFHPNEEGQARLAQVSYAAGYRW